MFSDPQFWVFIAFIIFVGAIFNPVRKMLTSNLDSKIQEIKDNIEQAEKLKKDMQITLGKIKKRQNEVIAEIDLINQEAKDKIAIIEKNAQEKLEYLTNKHHALTSIKIDQMNRDAKVEIQQYLTKIAVVAVLDLLAKKLDDKEKQNLISKSIREVGLVLKN